MEAMNIITKHAHQRMAQRNIVERDIEIVLRFAKCLRRTGADFFVLTKNCLPAELNRQYARLIGTVLIFDDYGVLQTAYRNRKAFAQIKRKSRLRRVYAT